MYVMLLMKINVDVNSEWRIFVLEARMTTARKSFAATEDKNFSLIVSKDL